MAKECKTFYIRENIIKHCSKISIFEKMSKLYCTQICFSFSVKRCKQNNIVTYLTYFSYLQVYLFYKRFFSSSLDLMTFQHHELKLEKKTLYLCQIISSCLIKNKNNITQHTLKFSITLIKALCSCIRSKWLSCFGIRKGQFSLVLKVQVQILECQKMHIMIYAMKLSTFG